MKETDAIDEAEWEDFWTITAWEPLTLDAGCKVFAVEARKSRKQEVVCTCAEKTASAFAKRYYEHMHTFKVLRMDVTFATPPIWATVGWLMRENDSGGFDLYGPHQVTVPSKAPLEPQVEAE